MKKITLADYMKSKEDKKKFRLKVSYGSENEEDDYRPDIKRMIEESR
jgi:hypothetical protein